MIWSRDYIVHLALVVVVHDILPWPNKSKLYESIHKTHWNQLSGVWWLYHGVLPSAALASFLFLLIFPGYLFVFVFFCMKTSELNFSVAQEDINHISRYIPHLSCGEGGLWLCYLPEKPRGPLVVGRKRSNHKLIVISLSSSSSVWRQAGRDLCAKCTWPRRKATQTRCAVTRPRHLIHATVCFVSRQQLQSDVWHLRHGQLYSITSLQYMPRYT